MGFQRFFFSFFLSFFPFSSSSSSSFSFSSFSFSFSFLSFLPLLVSKISDDPTRDFRAMGMLGLKHLNCFATRDKETFRKMCEEMHSRTERFYPIATAGFFFFFFFFFRLFLSFLLNIIPLSKYKPHPHRNDYLPNSRNPLKKMHFRKSNRHSLFIRWSRCHYFNVFGPFP